MIGHDAACLCLDPRTPDRALVNGQVIALRPLEAKLLFALANAHGAIVGWTHLYAALYGYHPRDPVEPGNLYSITSRLRRAFRRCPPAAIIETQSTIGMRLLADVYLPHLPTDPDLALPEG